MSLRAELIKTRTGARVRLQQSGAQPIRQTYTHVCTQRIAGQGDNGAYGMRLKNVSGSSSADAHHAWMMYFPRYP